MRKAVSGRPPCACRPHRRKDCSPMKWNSPRRPASVSWCMLRLEALEDRVMLNSAEGDSISLDMHGTDATGTNALSYSSSNLPTGLSLNAGTGLISGILPYGIASPGSPSSYIAYVSLIDDHFASDFRSFTWT